MIVRHPIAAGKYYPRNRDELQSSLEKFSRRADVEKVEVIGAVAPHSGLIYAGLTQAHVYKSIAHAPVFVVLGPNHMQLGSPASIMVNGLWKTPLGDVRVDTELAEAIKRNSKLLEEDVESYSQEYSIETQLPWLMHYWRNPYFVPITLNTKKPEEFVDVANAIRLGASEARRSVVVIASSDFTHYGDVYGFVPTRGGEHAVLESVKGLDMEAARAVTSLDTAKFLAAAHKTNICGWQAIATMMEAVKGSVSRGRVVHYSTSYDLTKDMTSFIGYAGVVLF